MTGGKDVPAIRDIADFFDLLPRDIEYIKHDTSEEVIITRHGKKLSIRACGHTVDGYPGGYLVYDVKRPEPSR